MDENCGQKIAEIRLLAEEFRDRARLAGMAHYIALMTQTADELDLFANMLEAQPPPQDLSEHVLGRPVERHQVEFRF